MLITDEKQLQDALISSGYLTEEQIEESLSDRQVEEKSLVDWIKSKELLTEKEINEAIAIYLNLEFVDLEEVVLDKNLLESIDSLTAQQYEILPIEDDFGTLKVAMADPINIKALDDLTILLEKPIEAMLADEEKLRELVTEHYGASSETLEDMFSEMEDMEVVKSSDDDSGADESAASEAPIIKLVNGILTQALKNRASDIHFEPFEKEFRLRYRIDGVCQQHPGPPKKMQGAIMCRLKIMSGMDIAEKRIPQDGRIKMRMLGKEIDFRVSALPCLHGESFVLRLLDKESVSLGLEQVGFIGDNKQIFDQLIRKPNGILLVTGPTGSGKTTTLYSALNEINTDDRKLMTIENPVEYMLDGINQVQVTHDIGLDFALGLRAMLRQTPDVIMVGEIRDNETASIAIRAALTGHLVFSTLHTNDAPSAITRLVDMGINPYLVSSSIQAVMAQRLVRTICSKCKVEDKISDKVLDELQYPEEYRKDAVFYKGEGCEACSFTGYKGRTGIFELMVMNQELKDLVLDNVPALVLRKAALQGGMKSLRQDGYRKVQLGMTTVLEVARIATEEKH